MGKKSHKTSQKIQQAATKTPILKQKKEKTIVSNDSIK